MPTRTFDELKTIKKRSVDYDAFFDGIKLNTKTKKDLISFAEEMEIVILYFMMMEPEEISISTLAEKYADMAVKFLNLKEPSAYVQKRAEDYAKDFVETTENHKEDPWYSSADRAKLNAENETLTLAEHGEYSWAVKSGKTKKTWVTMQDDRVRESHVEVDGMTIGIFEDFVVGSSVMGYPRDLTNNPEPEEVVNCRCYLQYS